MENYIELALAEAHKALKQGEVPIGACIVRDGKVIAKAHNIRQKTRNAVNHAEIIAIQKACKKLHDWRLSDCDIYITLKPCPMCAGAIANARIKNVYYAAEETNSDDHLCESIFLSNRLNHKPNLIKIENEECSKILSDFFASRRKENRD